MVHPPSPEKVAREGSDRCQPQEASETYDNHFSQGIRAAGQNRTVS